MVSCTCGTWIPSDPFRQKWTNQPTTSSCIPRLFEHLHEFRTQYGRKSLGKKKTDCPIRKSIEIYKNCISVGGVCRKSMKILWPWVTELNSLWNPNDSFPKVTGWAGWTVILDSKVIQQSSNTQWSFLYEHWGPVQVASRIPCKHTYKCRS